MGCTVTCASSQVDFIVRFPFFFRPRPLPPLPAPSAELPLAALLAPNPLEVAGLSVFFFSTGHKRVHGELRNQIQKEEDSYLQSLKIWVPDRVITVWSCFTKFPNPEMKDGHKKPGGLSWSLYLQRSFQNGELEGDQASLWKPPLFKYSSP